jgi:hypothetical protein
MQLQGQILAVFIFASLMFGCVSQVSLLEDSSEVAVPEI